MFEVGKKVVCVDDTSPEGYSKPKIKKGEIYPLRGIHLNDCCGSMVFDVGIKVDQLCEFYCVCGKLTRISCPGTIEWYNHSRFRPVDYSFADKALEQIFEQELILP